MDKDLVLVFGNFNILHPGHLRLLRYAKSISKRLVVGLFSDRLAGDAIFVSEDLRLETILANSWVDDALMFFHFSPIFSSQIIESISISCSVPSP